MENKTVVQQLNEKESDSVIFWKTQAYILASVIDKSKEELNEELKKINNELFDIDKTMGNTLERIKKTQEDCSELDSITVNGLLHKWYKKVF